MSGKTAVIYVCIEAVKAETYLKYLPPGNLDSRTF